MKYTIRKRNSHKISSRGCFNCGLRRNPFDQECICEKCECEPESCTCNVDGDCICEKCLCDVDSCKCTPIRKNPPRGVVGPKGLIKMWSEIYDKVYEKQKNKSLAGAVAWTQVKKKYEKDKKTGKWHLKKKKVTKKKSTRKKSKK